MVAGAGYPDRTSRTPPAGPAHHPHALLTGYREPPARPLAARQSALHQRL